MQRTIIGQMVTTKEQVDRATAGDAIALQKRQRYCGPLRQRYLLAGHRELYQPVLNSAAFG